MRNLTLSLYLGRQYLLWFLVFLFGLASIIFLFEVTELLRRTREVQKATLDVVLQMGAYKLPDTIEKILPFVVLFSGMFSFWRMTRSSELVVARAAGVSAWQFLAPAMAITFLFGVFNVAMLNPIGASMNARYREMESRYLNRGISLELTGAGLWLRQNDGDKRYLLHAEHVEQDPTTIEPLIAFIYDSAGHYTGRIDAPRAVLEGGKWKIRDGWLNEGADQPPQFLDSFEIKTSLTLEKMQESMAPPNTISFWKLPDFGEALRSIGLPSSRHELQFQSLLAEPFLLCAMVLFAAAFSLRLDRQGGILNAVMAGIFIGSVIFFLNNLVIAMGANQTLPITMAAWAIPLAAAAAGHSVLLYLEDG